MIEPIKLRYATSSNPFDLYRCVCWSSGETKILLESSKPDDADEWWVAIHGRDDRDALGPYKKEVAVWHFAMEIADYCKRMAAESVLDELCKSPAFCKAASTYIRGSKEEPS